ncbi:MAG: ABC transporter permease, partial [Ekhidna sp.]
ISKSILNTSLFVALFILLIAIVNFINLVTAKASTRAKEVGIRKAIGSRKASLLKQFLFENSILVFISLAISIVLSYFLLNTVNEFLSILGMQLYFNVIDTSLIFFVSFITIIISIIYPSIVLSSFNPIKALTNRQLTSSKTGISLRKGLTLFQFTLVQVFVIAAIVVGLQLQFFNNEPLGFSSEKIVVVDMPSQSKIDLFISALKQNAAIQQVSVGSTPPMTVGDFALGTSYRLSHEERLAGRDAEMKIIDPEYLSLYDINLLAGRNFRENKDQFDEFIVNETLIKSMNWTPEETIGQKIAINEGEATVVGVVEDFHNHSLQNDITPTILINWNGWRINAFVKASDTEGLIYLEEVWKDLFPTSIYGFSFLEDTMKKEYLLESLIFNGFKVFSGLVIFLGCLGLLGLMSFITLQKTKEIGIRKVMGASVGQIVQYFSKEFVILISIAFVIASPIVFYFMNQWLDTFTYHISLSVWMFIAGGLIVLGIGSAISIMKSMSAARANPVQSLKCE